MGVKKKYKKLLFKYEKLLDLVASVAAKVGNERGVIRFNYIYKEKNNGNT